MTKTNVQTVENTAVSLPDDILATLAQDAKESASLERPSMSNISLRAGVVSYNGEPVKGNVLNVVVVAASHLNAYYDKAWDPDSVSAPACFALSTTGKAMQPHTDVVNPQHATCEGCPKNEWGSAGGKSRGKACKETRRLVLLPADALDSEEDVQKAELALVKLPVTSTPAWGNFVNSLSTTLKLPHYAVEAEFTTHPDAKSQFKVMLTPVRQITSIEVLKAVMNRRADAEVIAMTPLSTEVEATASATAPAKF